MIPLKFLFASFVLFVPTVYGCVEFEAATAWPNGNELLHSVLFDHGQVVCTMEGFPSEANTGTMTIPNLYLYACLDKFLATFNGETGEVRYKSPSGNYTFSASLVEGVWRACEYGCLDSCWQQSSESSSHDGLLLEESCVDAACTNLKPWVKWVPPPHGRSTIGIVYGCLLTLVACSWTVLHLNVPSEEESTRHQVLRKLKWTLVALTFPEFLCGVAGIEYFMAKQSCEGMKGPDGKPWTLVHGFFANMGGFVLHSRGAKPLPLNGKALKLLVEEQKIEVPRVTKQQILDKSKTGDISKAFTVLQVAWFAVQFLARRSKGLLAPALEFLTLFMVVISIVTFVFEWHKPKDVAFAMIVECDGELGEDLEERISKIYNQTYSDSRKSSDNKYQDIKTKKRIPFGVVANSLLAYERFEDKFERRRASTLAYSVSFFGGVYNGLHTVVLAYHVFPNSGLKTAWTACFAVAGATPFFVIFMAMVNDHLPNKVKNFLRWSTVLVYGAARLCLFFIALACFYSQPRSVYKGIIWTNYLPHGD